MSRQINTYNAWHRRLQQDDPARSHTCRCGAGATQWSYLGSAPDERVGPDGRHAAVKYSLNRDYYEAVCASCHMKRDSARGEGHGSSYLTAEDIRAIRAERAAGSTLKEIAPRYGTTWRNIGRITRRETWKHI